MKKINRVQELYEVATKFYSLPPMARYIIGTTLLIVEWNEFMANEDKVSDLIFLRAIQKKKYRDFREIVKNYKVPIYARHE